MHALMDFQKSLDYEKRGKGMTLNLKFLLEIKVAI